MKSFFKVRISIQYSLSITAEEIEDIGWLTRDYFRNPQCHLKPQRPVVAYTVPRYFGPGSILGAP